MTQHTIALEQLELLKWEALLARVPVGKRTIEEWIQDEGFPHIKKGRVLLFNWPHVVDWFLAIAVRPRRPAWFTPLFEDRLQKYIRDLVAGEVATRWAGRSPQDVAKEAA